jgi:acyl CoA:acetate/3-ketoacid CoA transferase beta subunit
VTGDGLVLREIAPDTTVDEVKKATGTELRVDPAVRPMRG